MRREAFKDFMTESERLDLVAWFEGSTAFTPGLSRGEWGYEGRSTTRQQKVVDFPPIVKELNRRAFELFKFTPNCTPQSLPCGEPVIAVKTFKGGDTYSHRDPTGIVGMAVLRMNIIVQKSESGGILHVQDEGDIVIPWDTDECELHCYEVTQHTHAVSEVKGDTDRFILIFSMQVPYDDWENGRITRNDEIQPVTVEVLPYPTSRYAPYRLC
jgi:hypothetical protein